MENATSIHMTPICITHHTVCSIRSNVGGNLPWPLQWLDTEIEGHEDDVLLEGVKGPHCAFTLLFQPSAELEAVRGSVMCPGRVTKGRVMRMS